MALMSSNVFKCTRTARIGASFPWTTPSTKKRRLALTSTIPCACLLPSSFPNMSVSVSWSSRSSWLHQRSTSSNSVPPWRASWLSSSWRIKKDQHCSAPPSQWWLCLMSSTWRLQSWGSLMTSTLTSCLTRRAKWRRSTRESLSTLLSPLMTWLSTTALNRNSNWLHV